MPAWIFRRAKSLYLCDLQRAETEQVVSYPLKAQKCCSIVPRGTEKAGKKFLISYPLFVATCLPAVKLVCFQTFLIGDWLNGPALFYPLARSDFPNPLSSFSFITASSSSTILRKSASFFFILGINRFAKRPFPLCFT